MSKKIKLTDKNIRLANTAELMQHVELNGGTFETPSGLLLGLPVVHCFLLGANIACTITPGEDKWWVPENQIIDITDAKFSVQVTSENYPFWAALVLSAVKPDYEEYIPVNIDHVLIDQDGVRWSINAAFAAMWIGAYSESFDFAIQSFKISKRAISIGDGIQFIQDLQISVKDALQKFQREYHIEDFVPNFNVHLLVIPTYFTDEETGQVFYVNSALKITGKMRIEETRLLR